ncbi:hypothetical protein GQ600_23619 [Phytophthora cactorum]|nr:hypothetical protein GQ600_23619 [Phytophthora cactorum]
MSRLADRLMVLTWQHHLRHFNKRADTVATGQWTRGGVRRPS